MAKVEARSLESPIQPSDQAESLLPEASIAQSVQAETQLPKTPAQQLIQSEAQSPEAERSIQKKGKLEARSSETETLIQGSALHLTHDTIQTPQNPTSLFPAENKVSSELITSGAETIQLVSQSKIAGQKKEPPDSSKILKPSSGEFNDFPQLPTVLQNLSIWEPLIQTVAQKIPKPSYSPPSSLSFPPALAEKQTLKSPTQYAKIDIPPQTIQSATVQCFGGQPSTHATPTKAAVSDPGIRLYKKELTRSAVVQRAETQSLISVGKEENSLEKDTSDIIQDLDTLAQMIYEQLQQRLRVDQERHGYRTGRLSR
jgi:hypothetical protein